MPISRTHRPRFFRDVTGQQHITETLRKEVASGILGHAFLFSGPRGVGKTTTARILAKALLNEKTENGEPPVESSVNIEVDTGSCIDLMELDAASHTGVEHVREAIVEHVRFLPARWKRKVYIIDECHMLSTSAWNALLKTLEEPPPYAYFILATTELHKVPETIISRCQRFEFHRISSADLTARITELASGEEIHMDDAVIRSIVHASDGCVRDAESLLDQLASLGAERITSDVASLVLPMSRVPEIAKLVGTCLSRNVGNAIAEGRRIVDEGMPAVNVLNEMIGIVRAILRCEDPSERERLKNGDEGDRAIYDLVGLIGRAEIGDLALMLIERRRDAKTGTDPQFALELVILAFAGGLLQGAPSKAPDPPSIAPAPPAIPSSRSGSSTTAPTDVKKDETKTKPGDLGGHDHESGNRGERSNAGSSVDLNDLRILWNTIIREVEKENRSLPFILKVTKPVATDGERITLAFAYDFHKEKIMNDLKMKRIVEQSIATVLKYDRVIIEGIVENGTETPVAGSPKDIVSKVLEAFGGEVVSS